jgi:hypothetical protein
MSLLQRFVSSGALMPSARGRRSGERVFGHVSIRPPGWSPGDHYEGHFEGQNAAGEGWSELAAACVS